MALTFQGNELGVKEHHWVPSDKAALAATSANYLAGRKPVSLEYGEGFVNFERSKHFGVRVM